MSEFYFFYGIFTISTWVIMSIINEYLSPSKFWKKHIKKEKKIFFFFSLFSIALFWISLKQSAEQDTLDKFWLGSLILFIIYSIWSGRKVYQDYSRIKSIEERRLKNEKK